MTVNVNTNIDENLKKIEEMLKKLELLEKNSEMIRFVTIQEFSKIRNISLKTSQDIFNLPDFPSENYGKQKVVEITALKRVVCPKKR